MSSTRRACAAPATAPWAVVCLLLVACTSNPYFIGASCPDASDASAPCNTGGSAGSATGGSAGAAGMAGAAGSASDLSFALDLDHSGASQLTSELTLPGGGITASLRFRGETATLQDWPSDQGALLIKSAAAPVVQLEAPFTDGTRAVGFSSTETSYIAQSAEPGEVGADDFALELVLRAAPGSSILGKRTALAGWSVALGADGALTLDLADEQLTLQIASEPLVPMAWYHCLFWVSRTAGGQAFCNARPGAATALGALGSLGTAQPLTVGGGAAGSAGSELAHFSLFRTPAGGLGAADSWAAASRQRFAELTGVAPRVARGSLLHQPGLRNAPAYLDLQRGAAARHLFLVGEDWPRITCRADAAGVRDCGYLSEPKRTRWLDAAPEEWSASALTLLGNNAAFADGEQRMTGLVPSALSGPHSLSVTGTYGGARQALSFFARAEQGHLVGASVSGFDLAVFDVEAGSVVTEPTGTRASIEAWGDGLFRCALSFEPDPGPLTYELTLLDDANADSFAGDGVSAWLDLAGLQLDVGDAYAGSLLAADDQPGDRLSFVGDDGNLPAGSDVVERLRVLLPQGPRLTDQAVLNFNRGGEFENQVQLYVTGDTSELKFWALSEGEAHWAFTHSVSPIDGLRHQIEASWTPSAASLSMDGEAVTRNALLANEPPFLLDRIDVGYSAGSGSLAGLVAGIEIGDR
ncbi:MAG TPA: hypothetical protein VHP33_18435 [Polyangiaceae bacterium]|nr:hypothetical protein [Polyangiaceae bacterium]